MQQLYTNRQHGALRISVYLFFRFLWGENVDIVLHLDEYYAARRKPLVFLEGETFVSTKQKLAE